MNYQKLQRMHLQVGSMIRASYQKEPYKISIFRGATHQYIVISGIDNHKTKKIPLEEIDIEPFKNQSHRTFNKK